MAHNGESGSVNHEGVVQHRKHLLGSVDFDAWRTRLKTFMDRQPGSAGGVTISDIHLPSAGGSSGTLMFAAQLQRGGKQHFVLRYATAGGLFHDYDLPGQYQILKGLQGTGVPVPGVVGLDADGALLGVTGYVMNRVDGDVPPPTYQKAGLIFDASPQDRRKMVLDAAGTLAKLHALDWRTLGIEFLLYKGSGTTADERAASWYWRSLRWGCPDEVASMEPLYRTLIERQPPETYIALNHGDAMLANYMFRDHRVVAVLDWELAFLGNPANDLAYQIYTHAFLGLGCEPLPGVPTPEEWKAEYERVSGRPVRHWNYAWFLTCFKLHISLLLVYRSSTPELEASRRRVRQYTWQQLVDACERLQKNGP